MNNAKKKELEPKRRKIAEELKSGRARLRSLNHQLQKVERQIYYLEHRPDFAIYRHRIAVAEKLKSSKDRLKKLNEFFQKTLKNLISTEYVLNENDSYPSVPKPLLSPSEIYDKLPFASGIYFLWRDNKIEYIGKSRLLPQRLKLGNHHILQADHKISFVLVDENELNWAECYYIGIHKPFLNFGRTAFHRTKG